MLCIHEKQTGLLPKEAAIILGCGENMIKKMVEKNELKCYTVGKRIRFTRSDLMEWIDEAKRKQAQCRFNSLF